MSCCICRRLGWRWNTVSTVIATVLVAINAPGPTGQRRGDIANVRPACVVGHCRHIKRGHLNAIDKNVCMLGRFVVARVVDHAHDTDLRDFKIVLIAVPSSYNRDGGHGHDGHDQNCENYFT